MGSERQMPLFPQPVSARLTTSLPYPSNRQESAKRKNHPCEPRVDRSAVTQNKDGPPKIFSLLQASRIRPWFFRDAERTETAAGFRYDDDKTRRIGYIGGKRYVRPTTTPSGNASAVLMAYLGGGWFLSRVFSRRTGF